MTPIPPSEQWLHDNPTAMAMVKQGLAESAAGQVAPREIPLPDYAEAYIDGHQAVAYERPLYAPRNPYPDDTEAHEGWLEGAIDGGINRDYTNGVRNDGKERV